MTTLPRFIQISTLTTYPASLLNRDDSGLSKRIPFGGVSRTRISSQCLKRHWRTAEGPWSLLNVDPDIVTSVRSRKTFPEKIEKPLIESGLDAEKVVAASQGLQSELYGSKGTANAAKNKKSQSSESESPSLEMLLSPARSEVVVLGLPEIEFLKKAVRDLASQDKSAKEITGGAAQWYKDHKKDFQALKYGAGLDAAMFGRFISGDADARVSAAVHVAHAFTVHAEESETDYFTAVDDLDNMGSAHINATELTSGIFYNYIVVDVPQLVSNIEGCPPGEWRSARRDVAGRLIKHLLHLIATVTPGAKLGSTAPYARPWFVMAEAGESQPFTLADAFYRPVPLRDDMRAQTLSQLESYVSRSDEMYGMDTKRLVASMYDVAIPQSATVSLNQMGEDLEQAVISLRL